jgi:hypothetical protein
MRKKLHQILPFSYRIVQTTATRSKRGRENRDAPRCIRGWLSTSTVISEAEAK